MLPTEDKIMALLQENAEQNILPHFKALQSHQIREKSPGSLVTDADESSEAFLTKYLADMIPGSLVVGEEAVHKDKKILDYFQTDRPVWIIDPIDGTYNFAHGRSKWGVFVSLYYKGEIVFGILYDVLKQEFIFAKKGEGTYYQSQDGIQSRLQLKRPPEKPVSLYCGHVGGSQAWHFKKLKPFCGEIHNVRCSMHDFWSLLTGKIDFTFHTSTTPWDHSAPAITVMEAGGFIAAGPNADPVHPGLRQEYLLATYDETVWRELFDKFYAALPKKK